MKRRVWSWLWGSIAILGLAVLGVGDSANASYPPPQSGVRGSSSSDDGYDALPPGLQAVSMSRLVQMGLVHPPPNPSQPIAQPPAYHNPHSAISWGTARNMSNRAGANEPAAAMHPTDPSFALSGGTDQWGRIGTFSLGIATTTATSSFTPSTTPNATPHPGAWVDIAPFPSVIVSPTPGEYPLKLKRASAACYPANGKCYVLGGRHGIDGEDLTLRYIWEYTPGQPDSWTLKNAQLDSDEFAGRYTANMAVAVLTDTNGPRIYAIGGNNLDSDISGDVRVYDPIADNITNLDSDPWPADPPRLPGGYAVFGNKLYIFGGFSVLANSGVGAVFSDTWRFDPMAPSGQKWTQLTSADLHVARGYIAGATLDGKIYAIGGDTWDPSRPPGSRLVPLDNVERLDPDQANPMWTAVASLPTARGAMGAWAYETGTGYAISGRVVVAGGHYDVPDDQAYIYGPTSNSWAAFPNMLHATRNYGAAQLNGYLYAFGGYDYSDGIPSGANFSQRYDANGPVPTPSNTPVFSPTPTATPFSSDYTICTFTNIPLDRGTTLVAGSQCDDCLVNVSLPFPYTLYDRTFTSAVLSSNGALGFEYGEGNPVNTCLPDVGASYAIYAFWDDLLTDVSCVQNCGIYTSVTGIAPNRAFNIEWRAVRSSASGGGNVNFEIRLHENQAQFDIVYGAVPGGGNTATVGVQMERGRRFDQYSCDNNSLTPGLQLTFMLGRGGCSSPTPTFSHTPSVTSTPSPGTATPAPTSTPTLTVTPCAIGFSDLSPSDPFFNYVRYLYCAGVVSGYGDDTFRPHNNTTRAQLCKITVLARGWGVDCPSSGHFTDVPPDQPFYCYIETAYEHGIIAGYGDGTFRPDDFVTRGQLCKVIVLAMVWGDPCPTTGHFSDVPPSHPFFCYIETAHAHAIISAYADGSFRPDNNATRGQTCKIVYRAITGR